MHLLSWGLAVMPNSQTNPMTHMQESKEGKSTENLAKPWVGIFQRNPSRYPWTPFWTLSQMFLFMEDQQSCLDNGSVSAPKHKAHCPCLLGEGFPEFSPESSPLWSWIVHILLTADGFAFPNYKICFHQFSQAYFPKVLHLFLLSETLF